MLNFFFFTFTPETFLRQCWFWNWLNQIRKYFENKKIFLLVIYSDRNFVCQELPELQDRNINQLFSPQGTLGKCFLANVFIFRILTNKWWVEISLPLHRGVDVSFQEITCWFSERKNIIFTRAGRIFQSYLKTDIRKSLRGEKKSLLCTISQIALCLQPSSSSWRIWKRKSILSRPAGDPGPESSLLPTFRTLPGPAPASLLNSVLNPMVGRRKESGRESSRSEQK